MCKASVVSDKTVRAQEGETYGIQQTSHGIAGFVPKGMTAAGCVACLKGEREITLIDIPRHLQRQYGIGQAALATFKESIGHRQDITVLDDDAKTEVPLDRFIGAKAYIGIMDQTGLDAIVANQQKVSATPVRRLVAAVIGMFALIAGATGAS